MSIWLIEIEVVYAKVMLLQVLTKQVVSVKACQVGATESTLQRPLLVAREPSGHRELGKINLLSGTLTE